MSDDEKRSPLKQVNETVIDVRNEAIVQTANLYLVARKVALVGIGITFLGIDATVAFAQRAIERGEVAEADAGKALSGLQKQATDRAKAADQLRVDATEKVTADLLQSTNGLLRWLRVPEVKIVFKEEAPTQDDEEPSQSGPVVD